LHAVNDASFCGGIYKLEATKPLTSFCGSKAKIRIHFKSNSSAKEKILFLSDCILYKQSMANEIPNSGFKFKDGFAEGFTVPIPETFRTALENKELSRGDLFYPKKTAYDSPPWREVLTENGWFLQIKESMTGGETVLFDLYVRNQDGTAFLPTAVHKLHWDEFIKRLQTGDFSNLTRIQPDKKPAKDYFLVTGTDVNHGQPPPAINFKYRAGREMDELIGICKGIAADNVVIEKEARYLHQWLRRNSDIASVWPARELAARLARILWDGVVSPDEAEELRLFLQLATGETEERKELIEQSSIKSNLATLLPFDSPAPEVEFTEREFCFTGKFLSGTRRWCFTEVEKRGGIARDRPNACHYLVLGELGSRDWAHSSHGRKIEAAMERKQKNVHWPQIVSEQHWAKFLH
jgi:hypothetical protein